MFIKKHIILQRTLSLLLALTICFSLTATAFAAEIGHNGNGDNVNPTVAEGSNNLPTNESTEGTATDSSEDDEPDASPADVVAATGITLDRNSIELSVGSDPITLTATISPENATNKTVVWTSANEEIATVADGIVTAVANGETTIIAKTEDGAFSASCSICVSAEANKTCNIEKIIFGQLPNFENYPVGYQFSKDQKEYNLSYNDKAAFIFQITMGEIEENLYYEVTQGTKSVKKGKLQQGEQNIMVLPSYLPKVGQTKTLVITIGTKENTNGSFTEVYDQYTYNVSRIPGLSSLSVTDTQNSTCSLTPVFSTGEQYRYVVLHESDDTHLKISAKPNNAATQIYVGNDTTAYNTLTNYEIDYSSYSPDSTGVRAIPIKLVYSGADGAYAENTYYIFVSLPDYTPVITEQPTDVTVEKNEEKTLSVKVETPLKGEISYQWYRSVNCDSALNWYMITGATSSAYQPDTSAASNYAYKCIITNTVDGHEYTVGTNTAWYKINLTYVNGLTLRYQPGSFKEITTGPEENAYKKEYYLGETLDSISLALNRPEYGTDYTCTWYYNTTDSTDLKSATMLNAYSLKEAWHTYGELYYNNYFFNDKFDVGTYYIFCVVTATDLTNPDNKNEVVSETVKITINPVDLGVLSGSGTAKDPFQLKTAQDLQYLQQWVNKDGRSFEGMYFKMMDNITLPEGWEPIGCTKDGSKNPKKGENMNTFKGVFDGGGHTLTVPVGGLPLFGCVWDTTVQNLNIYGEQIAGYGLVNNMLGVGLSGNAVTIDNVRLLKGTKTLKSGLVGGIFGLNAYAACSANFLVTIRNCTIEEGVVIGYTGLENRIGSIAGIFQGTIENCVSYATVQGVDYVGGLVGTQDNAMARCQISNSQFHGTVNASGEFAGGIIGGGYAVNDSAPNGCKPDILGCTVTGTVFGNKCVGGITGGDEFTVQAWNNSQSSVSGNRFTGKVSGQKYVGAIIGYYNSMNKFDTYTGNTYSTDCGVSQAIGFIHYLDTSYENPTLMDGTILVNTGDSECELPKVFIEDQLPQYYMTWKANHNRTDDPLGKTEQVPGMDTENPTCYELAVSGTYKTEYTVGDTLDLSGIKLTAKWTDGSTTDVSLDDVKIEGYDKNKTGEQTITLSYDAVKAYITVKVTPKSTKITVNISILGDSKHGDNGSTHGLAMGGLTSWVNEPNFEADASETVWDVLQRVFKKHSMSVNADSNNSYGTIYIKSINGLGEFDNGSKSGWMFTVNGTHPEVGVAATYIKQGDTIVLHYTDDYTKEEGGKPVQDGNAAKAVDELIAKIGTVTLTDACKQKIDEARKAYNALSYANKKKVAKLSVLEAAEKQYTELKQADDKKKADTVIGLIKKIDADVTLDSEKAIKAARTAYDKLTADQKTLVTNYKALTSAETALAKLQATAEDQKKADEVYNAIAKLGNITLNSEKDIEAARKAYDALTDVQKKLVENIETLEKAEKKLAELKAVQEVLDLFNAAGSYLESLGTPGVGSVGGEWMALGLLRSDRQVGEDYYEAVVRYVQENIDENGRLHNAKSTENSRIILALTAMGKDVTNVDGHNLLLGLNDLDFVQKQGINGPIWALIALDSGNYPVPEGNVTREALLNLILAAQLEDGGWAISGEDADSDMTGMALQALAPYYDTNAAVKKAVDEALVTLSAMQNEDGSFSTFSGNGKVATSESISQVIVALTALGIDPRTDERFVKNGNSALDALMCYAVDGGFRHLLDGELDGMATEQGFYALTAYERFVEGKTSLYNMTDIVDMGGDATAVPAELGEPTEPTVPGAEPADVEPAKTSSAWWIIILVLVAGAVIVAVVVILPKIKKRSR